jgi:PTH2 family peptidyl-tRNA hydrolase
MKPLEEYEYKQVIVVRTDIRMSRGKLAAQVAHASVSSFYRVYRERREWAEEWLRNKQPKIVCRVDSISYIKKLGEDADRLGLPNVVIEDAGLTELAPGTITCIGIGPGPVELIDKVTGHLPLL